MSSRKKPYVDINDNLDNLNLIINHKPYINTKIGSSSLPQKELGDLANSKISGAKTGSKPYIPEYDGGSRRRKRHSRRRRVTNKKSRKNRKSRKSRKSRRHHRRR